MNESELSEIPGVYLRPIDPEHAAKLAARDRARADRIDILTEVADCALRALRAGKGDVTRALEHMELYERASAAARLI